MRVKQGMWCQNPGITNSLLEYLEGVAAGTLGNIGYNQVGNVVNITGIGGYAFLVFYMPLDVYGNPEIMFIP
jgi:hypothetical protein